MAVGLESQPRQLSNRHLVKSSIVNRKSSIGTTKHLTLCFEPIVKLMTTLSATFLIERVCSRCNKRLQVTRQLDMSVRASRVDLVEIFARRRVRRDWRNSHAGFAGLFTRCALGAGFLRFRLH